MSHACKIANWFNSYQLGFWTILNQIHFWVFVYLIPSWSGISKCWFLRREEGWSTWRIPLRAREWTNNKLNPYNGVNAGMWNPGHSDGRWLLSPLCHPHFPCFNSDMTEIDKQKWSALFCDQLLLTSATALEAVDSGYTRKIPLKYPWIMQVKNWKRSVIQKKLRLPN